MLWTLPGVQAYTNVSIATVSCAIDARPLSCAKDRCFLSCEARLFNASLEFDMSIISHSLAILPLAFISLSVGVSTAHAETIDVKISAQSTTLPQELRVIHSVGKGESCDAAYSAMMKNAETTAGELKVPMAFFNAKDPNSVDRLQSLTCEPAGKKVKVEARVLMGKLYEDSTTLPQEKVLGIISSTAIPKGKPNRNPDQRQRSKRASS